MNLSCKSTLIPSSIFTLDFKVIGRIGRWSDMVVSLCLLLVSNLMSETLWVNFSNLFFVLSFKSCGFLHYSVVFFHMICYILENFLLKHLCICDQVASLLKATQSGRTYKELEQVFSPLNLCSLEMQDDRSLQILYDLLLVLQESN